MSSFSSFANILDRRILTALSDLAYSTPTPVQARAIPLALEGKSILARAPTGSGKTAAYCVPLVQAILAAQDIPLQSRPIRATRALILVPTRELADQVSAHLRRLLAYCEKHVTLANLASTTVSQVQKHILSDIPDILVATPSRALAVCQANEISLKHIETLVVDEADLIFTYGYQDDLRQLSQDGYLPSVYQSIFMSATLTEDVESLSGLLTINDPVTLDLDQVDNESSRLTQYVVQSTEVDKFLLTYVMLKLKLIKGKCILFVNDVDRCYRLKLFLEQFSIKSCVLNAELPLNSRVHIVQEFNKGVYDYIIATDESAGKGDDHPKPDDTDERDEPVLAAERAEDDEQEPYPDSPSKKRKRDSPPPISSSKKKKRKGKDKEYGVTRGIDFIDVSCVVNFDLPTTSRGYTHRVGRTARAGRKGMALSFVVPRQEYKKNKVVGGVPSTERDEETWQQILDEQRMRGASIVDYNFDKEKVEAFRYRMEDALRTVTRAAIKEGKLKDLKNEVLKSDKLKAHFEDNPLDLEYLRHDKPLHPTRIQPHMKSVPKYLLPTSMATPEAGAPSESNTEYVPFKKSRPNPRQKGGSNSRKKKDPLKKFRSK